VFERIAWHVIHRWKNRLRKRLLAVASRITEEGSVTGTDTDAVRKTIWVQQVAVDTSALQIRLDVATAGVLSPQELAVAAGVQKLIDQANKAANRQDPVPSQVRNWWRGVLVEAAYRNLHAARAQIVDLYSEVDVDAEVPGAVARAQSALNRDDPRCLTQRQLEELPLPSRRALLRRLIEDGYEAINLKHAQLRSFRNNLFMAAAVIILLVALTIILVALHPSVLPLCFSDQAAGAASCPTRARTSRATGGDIGLVALVGLLGGALAATIAIRNIRGTSTPYDVPVALAWLKVPLGAFTAILGLVAIHGGFVPGLSALDSQEQIVAYALLLGFAQQAFTGVLDRKAQTLLDDIPSKESHLDATRCGAGGTGSRR
jgi:hypothetical protein